MVTITEDYVSSEIAELLREKGFPQSTLVCNTVYKPNGCISNNAKSFISPCYIGKDIYVFAPTLQMAMKWLREVYNKNIILDMIPLDEDCYVLWTFNIYYNTNYKIIWGTKQPKYNTYEEAAEAAIKYCLENLI